MRSPWYSEKISPYLSLYLNYKLNFNDQNGDTVMPITSTMVTLGGTPCDNPIYWVETEVENRYYPTEFDLFRDQCEKKDSSYISVNNKLELFPEMNEYDVQKYSGVFDTLTEQPFFDSMVPNAQANKEDQQYRLWARPTIQMLDTCSYTVDEVTDTLENSFISESTRILRAFRIIMFITLGLTAGSLAVIGVITFRCTAKGSNSCCLRVWKQVLPQVVWTVLAAMFILITVAQGRYTDYFTILKPVSQLDSCIP